MAVSAERAREDVVDKAQPMTSSSARSPAAAVTSQEMAGYRMAARRRAARHREAMEEWRQRAWKTAYQAAALLKAEYGVERVMLFGSLAREEALSSRSDVDLVAWGLDERVYYQAVSRLLDLDSSVVVDLLRAETLDSAVLEMIEAEGIRL